MLIIKQGESLPFVFDLDGESTSGWVCTLNLKRYPDDTTSINRTITAIDDKWTGFLTNDETEDLLVSQYTLTANLVKATTDEKDVKTKRFYVSRAW